MLGNLANSGACSTKFGRTRCQLDRHFGEDGQLSVDFDLLSVDMLFILQRFRPSFGGFVQHRGGVVDRTGRVHTGQNRRQEAFQDRPRLDDPSRDGPLDYLIRSPDTVDLERDPPGPPRTATSIFGSPKSK